MTAPRPGTLGARLRSADPCPHRLEAPCASCVEERLAGEVDVEHLLEEHRTATAELRRLRSANAELEERVADLERENDLYVERIEELEG